MRDVILLHGAIGASDQLEPLASVLKKNKFNIHLLNFSGHGQAVFNSAGFGIEIFANELFEFIKKNNLRQPHIFGYSMGGYVALYLASQQTDLIGNIATLGTKFEWSPEITAKEIKMLDQNNILEKVPKFAEALKKRHSAKWDELLKQTSLMMTDLGENNLLDKEGFSKIKNKVAVGLADGDTMVSEKETGEAKSNMPKATQFTLQNSKHPIETVNPDLLSQTLISFFT